MALLVRLRPDGSNAASARKIDRFFCTSLKMKSEMVRTRFRFSVVLMRQDIETFAKVDLARKHRYQRIVLVGDVAGQHRDRGALL